MWLRILVPVALLCLPLGALADSAPSSLPVRGFCVPAPSKARLEEFNQFIQDELAPRSVNVLILRVDYSFDFQSRPEMADAGGLSRKDAATIAEVCRKNAIRIVPLVNLLGHQSWHSTNGKLLSVHPEFDETPGIRLPEKYVWPNADGLYCKSYCPQHPTVHDVVFALVDEVCDAFGADAFHAGMDEVFYLGEEQCSRCRGRSKAELFSAEVTRIHDHLKKSGRQLWIWGDRLLDGKQTGLGEWEASLNETAAAIDRIPKDIVICDWHYERATPTSVYFAMKGFDVVTCPWKNPECAAAQVKSLAMFRDSSPTPMRNHLVGVAQTVWNGCGEFLDEFHGRTGRERERKPPEHTETKCFLRTFEEIGRLPRP